MIFQFQQEVGVLGHFSYFLICSMIVCYKPSIIANQWCHATVISYKLVNLHFLATLGPVHAGPSGMPSTVDSVDTGTENPACSWDVGCSLPLPLGSIIQSEAAAAMPGGIGRLSCWQCHAMPCHAPCHNAMPYPMTCPMPRTMPCPMHCPMPHAMPHAQCHAPCHAP